MLIFKCWCHRACKGNARGTVVQESGDDFPAVQVDEGLSRNIRAKCVFEEFCVVAAHAKDQQIARVAQDRVLEFIVVYLGKELA